MGKKSIVMLVLAMTAFTPLQLSAEIMYNIIDLGASYGWAWSINNNGQIVGESDSKATLFDSTGGGSNTDLGTVGGPSSLARSINNNGQIVGEAASDALGISRATLFDPTGNGNNIALDTSDFSSAASSINDNGQIVGVTLTETYGENYATLFDSTGAGNNINLGTLAGYTASTTIAINNSGQIVGDASFWDLEDHLHTRAVLYDPTGGGSNTDLGTLGGDYSSVRAINNNGQMVGNALTEAGLWHAVLFDSAGNIDLGEGVVTSINNNGQMVGSSNGVAMLFDHTGGGNNAYLHDLIDPTLGWGLFNAKSINDNGWIVGMGVNPNSELSAFLLTPVPEPATIFLLGLGTLALRRRKKT